MSDSPNRQTPEQFATYLRARAEEAISASVHHASLSQQYLTLSQKFAALAEQAAGNPLSVLQSAQQLEREVSTGAPSNPIGVRQVAAPLTTAQATIPAPHLNPASVSIESRDRNAAVELQQDLSNSPSAFYSPPAKFSATAATAESGSVAVSDSHANHERSPGVITAENPTASASSLLSATITKTPGRQKKRQALSLRRVVERARRVALEQTERVRVRAKKSDLKPQLRSTTEELKEELKLGRGPAMVSTVLMVLFMMILAIKQLEFVEQVELPPLVAGFSESIDPVEESLPIEPPAEDVGKQIEQPVEEPVEEMIEEPEPVPEPEPTPEAPPEPPPEPAVEPAPEEAMTDAALPETPDGTLPTNPDATSEASSAAVDTRSDAGRKQMVEKYGGSAASESAVGFALEWLAARQRANGTWDFVDVGPCKNPGTVNNPIGGTAYALLPFLAAGQTHKEGQYRKQVQAGLEFLTSIGVRAPAGYDLRGVINKADDDEDPNYAYYVHGAATLALCEAYGMTKDRKLRPFAEEAAKFLVNSQDPRGGGWRYNPQQPGSTSATAIQVMALKAAEKAGIKIPDSTWKGVSFYLDSVSVDGEGRYGYEVEKKTYGVSVTSMAMLSRMYLGWGRDDGDMRAGIALIDKRGPYDNLYYNYFATQVMKNWGGKEWDRWNGRLRDDLIAWQEKGGDAKGSWTPRDRDDYSKSGGRLLNTCLATLTLEVYYRYKPLLPDSAEQGTKHVDINSAPDALEPLMPVLPDSKSAEPKQ
jgi:hypothetical protein